MSLAGFNHCEELFTDHERLKLQQQDRLFNSNQNNIFRKKSSKNESTANNIILRVVYDNNKLQIIAFANKYTYNLN